MPSELRASPKLTYKLRLTPQMRLSLNLLQLPLVKLKEYIKQEIEKNPLLELIEREPKSLKSETQMIWSGEDEEKKEYRESLISKPPTLQDYLLRQFRFLANSNDERKIRESIIGNISNDGYLRSSIEDIAELNGATKSQVEKEDKKRPLTDQEIVDKFKKEGISVSRRTIAKYRNQLKILSSKSRRE